MFPVYQAPEIGNGFAIGANAVIHVLLSHGVAIGLFALFVVLDLRTDPRGPDATGREEQAFLHRFLKILVITITIAGAITGAAIWFTTMALAPRGIASMLRLFFRIWYVEWLVFAAEVVVILIYYFRWPAWQSRPAARRRLGIVYVALALMSAVLITGNLAFMLTPGAWTQTGGFWNAFFNPSYVPQLLSRIGIGFLVGAVLLVAYCAFARTAPRVRRAGLRLGGAVILATVAFLPIFVGIYWMTIPLTYLHNSRIAILTSWFSSLPWLMPAGNVLAFLLLGLCGLAALGARRRLTRFVVFPALLMAAAWVTQFERVREFIRGPYLIPGYLYASGVLVAEAPELAEVGIGRAGDRPPLAAGRLAFVQNCSACHTLDGINAIAERARGLSPDGLIVLMNRTHEMVPFMAPLAARPDERRQAAWFLHLLARGDLQPTSASRLQVAGKDPR